MPEDAHWLSNEQRAWLMDRLRRDREQSPSRHGMPPLHALAHPIVWLAALPEFVVAIADNDDKRSPNDKTGAAHGWCPPDSCVYNERQAEKAWSRLLELYGKALAAK